MATHHTTDDVVELTVERIVPRGFGIGFVEGLTVFVPLGAPGDRLRVSLVEIKKRTAFGEIVEIIKAGPQRQPPPCPYFGICGGCDFQQLTYEAQLEAKLGIVRDCLRRIGKIDFEGEIEMIASPEPLGYRTRARWQVDRENNSLAYFARDSHRLVPVRTCPKLVPELRAVVEDPDTTKTPYLGEQLLAAVGDSGSVSMFSGGLDTEAIAVTAAGETYACSAEVFFQANRFLLDALINAAVGDAHGARALDLYCGIGLFSLPLGRRFDHVIGIEADPRAVSFATQNVEAAGLANVEVSRGRVADTLRSFAPSNMKFDLVLLDPPRAGDDPRVIASIANLGPTRLAYVSCEPSILARDLRVLVDAGYRIDKVTALDMFPQTHHVETVAQLSLADFVP